MTEYYVDGAVGNDSNAGTSEGAGNAWATIGKAVSTIANGDVVWIKASATYAETITLASHAANDSPRTFAGYSSTTGDNGKVTVQPSSGTNVLAPGTYYYYCWLNLIFDGVNVSAHGVAGLTASHHGFFNCESNNSGSIGFQLNDSCTWFACEAHGNTLGGFNCDAQCTYVCCLSVANGGPAFEGQNFAGGAVAYNCVAYGTADKVAYQYVRCFGCTADGEETSSGSGLFYLKGNTGGDAVAVDCIVYDGRWGIEQHADQGHPGLITHNLLNSNSISDYRYAYSGSAWFDALKAFDVTSAPAFENESSDDYTLGSSSPCIDAGAQPGGLT